MENGLNVDSNGIYSIVEKMDETIGRLEDLFTRQNQAFDKLFDNGVWYGPAQLSANSKYIEMSSQYEAIITDLRSRSDFLRHVADSYELLDSESSNTIDESF